MTTEFDILAFEDTVSKINRYYGTTDTSQLIKSLQQLSLTFSAGNEWGKKDIQQQLQKIIRALESD